MSSWSDIKDLKKKKAYLDEIYEMPMKTYLTAKALGKIISVKDIINKPRRNEDERNN